MYWSFDSLNIVEILLTGFLTGVFVIAGILIFLRLCTGAEDEKRRITDDSDSDK